MRYLLTTGHRLPKFYKADGSIVEVELNYVDTKLISSIDESGKLTHKQVGGTPPCTGSLTKRKRGRTLNAWVCKRLNTLLYPRNEKTRAKRRSSLYHMSSVVYQGSDVPKLSKPILVPIDPKVNTNRSWTGNALSSNRTNAINK